MKRALITGVTGQDGAYLASHLLDLGYEVYGAVRRTASGSLWRLDYLNITDRVNIVDLDITDLSSCVSLVESTLPDEIYNLAAQSFVGASFSQPVSTAMVTGLGVTNLLESVRMVNTDIKFYQASTSEMFGNATESPQSENTRFAPRSPYGCAKLYAHHMAINYREYGIFTACGILFNHESPLRGEEFVTRKLIMQLADVVRGKRDYLECGNVAARRDWGHALDYVKGMHLMLQHDTPNEYVLATGETRSVMEFIKTGADAMGIKVPEIRVNKKFYRPAEIHELVGDPRRANKELGWRPQITFEQMVREMAESEGVLESSRGIKAV